MIEFAIPVNGRAMSTIHISNISILPMVTNQIKKQRISIVLLHSLKSGKQIDEDIFFRENSSCPPSLATSSRDMFHDSKADLIHCLLEFVACPNE